MSHFWLLLKNIFKLNLIVISLVFKLFFTFKAWSVKLFMTAWVSEAVYKFNVLLGRVSFTFRLALGIFIFVKIIICIFKCHIINIPLPKVSESHFSSFLTFNRRYFIYNSVSILVEPHSVNTQRFRSRLFLIFKIFRSKCEFRNLCISEFFNNGFLVVFNSSVC